MLNSKYHFRSVIAMALIAVSSAAFAGNNSNNSDTVNNYYNTTNSPQGGRADSDASANAIAGASSNASSSVGVINSTTVKTDVDTSQGQLQGQGQIQGQSNSQTITVQASKSYRPTVSSAYAATVFPTAPCMGSSSGGATGSLVSVSLASSWESKDCMALETARSFEQAGYSEDAMHIRCSSKYAKDAPSCKAIKEGKPVAVAKPQAVDTGATKLELDMMQTSAMMNEVIR